LNLLKNIRIFLNPDTSLRRKLKCAEHHLLDAISSLLQQFQHPVGFAWIKGHSGILGNERADHLANLGSLQDHIPPLHLPSDPTIPHVLHENSLPTGRYASQVVKKHHRQTVRKTTNDKLLKRWPSSHPIDFKLTCSATCAGLGGKYFLDSVNYRQRAFRIKLLYQTLPTNATVSTWKKYSTTNPNCPRCLNSVETLAHLATCPKTVEALPDLLAKATQIMRLHKATTTTYRIIKESPFPAPPYQLLNAFGCTEESFLSTPLAMGVIHHNDLEFFQSALGPCVHPSTARLWFTLTLDAWLSAFYQLVWKPRNRCVFD
jgi:ribosomal protein L34E